MTFDFRYPMITGPTEKEKLAQMQTYIHQLVDQLKWALNSNDSTQGNVQPNQSDESSADYVVGAGEKNGWTYKKWKSGTFEMFGRFTVAATVEGTAYGDMYFSEQFSIPTPFACSYAVVSGMATNSFIPVSGGLANNDNIGIILFRPTTFAVGQESSVSLHVTGKYM